MRVSHPPPHFSAAGFLPYLKPWCFCHMAVHGDSNCRRDDHQDGQIPTKMTPIPTKMTQIPTKMTQIPTKMTQIPTKMTRIPTKKPTPPAQAPGVYLKWASHFGSLFKMSFFPRGIFVWFSVGGWVVWPGGGGFCQIIPPPVAPPPPHYYLQKWGLGDGPCLGLPYP